MLISMKTQSMALVKPKKPIFNSFQNIYIALAVPVWFATFLTDSEPIFYFSKVVSQFALCAFLYARVEEEESHFSFMGLMGLTADFISEGFAVYNNEVTSELFALISAFFFTLCMSANIFDRWGFKKTYSEMLFISFMSFMVLFTQFLIQIEIETKSKFWTTNPCLYSLGMMVIFQMWRLKKTSSSSFLLGMIGTLIHVASEDIKFLFLGRQTVTLVKIVGLGELFSNYFMTMSIDDHMIWRRSTFCRKPLEYTQTKLRQKKTDEIDYDVTLAQSDQVG